MACVPGEFTTMAGRRLKAALAARVAPAWGSEMHVVLSGLTNTYSSYVTTFEEYQARGAGARGWGAGLEGGRRKRDRCVVLLLVGVVRGKEVRPGSGGGWPVPWGG